MLGQTFKTLSQVLAAPDKNTEIKPDPENGSHPYKIWAKRDISSFKNWMLTTKGTSN